MGVVAVLCTYNEAESLPAVLAGLKEAVPGIEILVVDDDSPDGTAQAAKSAGATVLVRRNVLRGRGVAGRAGYERAMAMGPGEILEMDADGSHNPADAPRILAALRDADIAVGSRAAGQGGEDERGMLRKILSAGAKWVLRLTLNLPLEDPTSGFRAFRRDALARIDPGTLTSRGPEIVEEVYVRAARAGLKMAEVPIVFRDRAAGASKLGAVKLLQVLWRCIRMSFR